jgi:hypothetical protein
MDAYSAANDLMSLAALRFIGRWSSDLSDDDHLAWTRGILLLSVGSRRRDQVGRFVLLRVDAVVDRETVALGATV